MNGLTSIELATGIVLGSGSGPRPRCPLRRPVTRPSARSSASACRAGPRPVLRELLRRAGTRRRCSPRPRPPPAAPDSRRRSRSTNRFPTCAHTDETRWQELVVAHLGLDDWVRLELTDELDVVGEIATRGLARHGAPVALQRPLPRAAARGGRRRHAPDRDRRRRGPRQLALGACGGGRVRCGARRGTGPSSPRAPVRARARAAGHHRPARPASLPLAPPPTRRARSCGRGPRIRRSSRRGSAPACARSHGEPAHRAGPRELRSAGGRRRCGRRPSPPRSAVPRGARRRRRPGFGWTDRGDAMEALFRRALPAPLLRRATKARFDGAFWGPESRALARSWDGEAADPAVVDPGALTREWAKQEPDAHTYLLLQATWLERVEKCRTRPTASAQTANRA